jgi:quinol monooxygenase YgiN
MVTVVARIRVLAGMAQKFEAIFARRRRYSLATEPGTRRYDLYREAAEPQVYTVIEEFTTSAAVQAHLDNSTDHHELMACFDGNPEVHRLQPCHED